MITQNSTIPVLEAGFWQDGGRTDATFYRKNTLITKLSAILLVTALQNDQKTMYSPFWLSSFINSHHKRSSNVKRFGNASNGPFQTNLIRFSTVVVIYKLRDVTSQRLNPRVLIGSLLPP
ncbi:hypothetical protein Zmor_005113 [Zophobas morio]|uniref:Uncharacterized protein n=1 Tax=Zophobas morio TaxID=2755281 RepID=A0AA38IX98_9CUCU|nr:hypothetical protein Zmor_005113 [Zophobas morio]